MLAERLVLGVLMSIRDGKFRMVCVAGSDDCVVEDCAVLDDGKDSREEFSLRFLAGGGHSAQMALDLEAAGLRLDEEVEVDDGSDTMRGLRLVNDQLQTIYGENKCAMSMNSVVNMLQCVSNCLWVDKPSRTARTSLNVPFLTFVNT